LKPGLYVFRLQSDDLPVNQLGFRRIPAKKLVPGLKLSFYVAAEDYIYGRTFVDPTSLEEKRTQNDVQITLGFGVPLQR
jgi:hypothetical protein